MSAGNTVLDLFAVDGTAQFDVVGVLEFIGVASSGPIGPNPGTILPGCTAAPARWSALCALRGPVRRSPSDMTPGRFAGIAYRLPDDATSSTSQSTVPDGRLMTPYGPASEVTNFVNTVRSSGPQGGFGRVIGVVEAYRKDLARLWYWVAEFTWPHL